MTKNPVTPNVGSGEVVKPGVDKVTHKCIGCLCTFWLTVGAH